MNIIASIIYFVILIAAYLLFNAGVLALLKYLRKRRMHSKDQGTYRKAAMRRMLTGVALLIVEALVHLSLIFSFGYYPMLSLMVPFTGDISTNKDRMLFQINDMNDVEEWGFELSAFRQLGVEEPALERLFTGNPDGYASTGWNGNTREEKFFQYGVYQQKEGKLLSNENFYAQYFSDWRLDPEVDQKTRESFAKEMDSEIEKANNLDKQAEAFRAANGVTEPNEKLEVKHFSKLALAYYRWDTSISNLLRNQKPFMEEKSSPAMLTIPKMTLKEHIQKLKPRTVEYLFPIVLRQLTEEETIARGRKIEGFDDAAAKKWAAESDARYHILAWGTQELEALEKKEIVKEDEIYFLYIRAAYSPLSFAFSNFSFNAYKGGEWTQLQPDMPLRDWANSVAVIYPVLLVIFLLFQFFAYSTHERKAAQAQVDLFHAIAHELKTPMGVVMLHGEKVLEAEASEDKDQRTLGMLEEIKGMNQRLMEVLQQSKLEGGTYRMKRESVSLLELAEEVVEGYEPLAEDKNITAEITGEDLRLYADGYLVRYAISNYLSNAIKHCPEGGQIKITIQKKRRGAVLNVWNSGSHVPQGSLGRIWDPFHKVGDGGDNAKKGSGLGLSIVRSIVSLHGGNCGANNTAHGVEFWCSFPTSKRS